MPLSLVALSTSLIFIETLVWRITLLFIYKDNRGRYPPYQWIIYMGELPAIPKILIRRERGRLSRRDDEAERWYEDCLEAIPSREVMRDDGRGGRKDERSAVTLLRGRSCAPAVASSSSVLCIYILIILLNWEKNLAQELGTVVAVVDTRVRFPVVSFFFNFFLFVPL